MYNPVKIDARLGEQQVALDEDVIRAYEEHVGPLGREARGDAPRQR